MLDPCILCRECRNAAVPRKVDCLAPFPNLRAIGNSKGGFKDAMSSKGWSLSEIAFYNRQIYLYYGPQSLPDLL